MAEDDSVLPGESNDNDTDDPNIPLLLPPSLTGKKGGFLSLHVHLSAYFVN